MWFHQVVKFNSLRLDIELIHSDPASISATWVERAEWLPRDVLPAQRYTDKHETTAEGNG